MNLNIKSIVCFALLMGVLGTSSADAQNNKKKKEVQFLNITSTIVDENNEPIANAEMITREGSATDFSDEAGKVSVTSVVGGIVLVEAMGYEDVVIDLSKGSVPEKIVMTKTGYLASSRDIVERFDESTQKLAFFNGAMSTVSGDELAMYPDYNLSNTLQGRVAGLVSSMAAGTHGANTANLYIRGQHRDDTNTIMVVIDGMERDYDDVLPEEIESITIYKDAIGKILYGSRGANGVMVITTKRGVPNKRTVNVKMESGASIATRTADYLNSYDYATLYNEACENDGISPLYSAETLEGYKNSTGENDLYYPDVDYSDYFLRNSAIFSKASLDMVGGNDRIKYAVVGGVLMGESFEGVGSPSSINRINVRGNLDVKITDDISFVANTAARFENRNYGYLDSSNVFNRVATYLPNEAPLTIDADVLGLDPSYDGVPYFGASTRVTANLLADTVYGGTTEERYNTNQTNLGLRFDLDRYVKGLSFGGDFMIDNYDYIKTGQDDIYATYAVVGTEEGSPVFQQVRLQSLESDDSRDGFSTKRTTGWKGYINYNRTMGKHDLSAGAGMDYYFQETTGKTQDIINTQTTLRGNYVYDDKISVEASFALLGSNRYSSSNRYYLSRAFGASWILSKEDFLKDSSVVDFLKVKASYGVLGYDAATSFLLYNLRWQNQGTTSFGYSNGTSAERISLVSVASDFKWESSSEYNVGLEGFFFGGRLRTEINYFHETRRDMVGTINSDVADIYGGYIEYDNMGSVRNQGMDAYVSWTQRSGDLTYSVGLTALVSKNKILEWNEVAYQDDENLRTVGQSTSAMYGYTAIGLFGKDVDIDSHPEQRLGDYQNGDVAYADINNDGVIDTRDISVIGDSFPTGVFGIDADIQYKNWGLYVLGTAEVGVDTWTNNAYYWVDGLDKYSDIVWDRYHETNNPTGSYPRLTTLSADNNNVNSTLWMKSASYFRLKNVQLSYTFNFKAPTAPVDKIKLFVNATNLFVISSIKELDPEVLNAGVSNIPIARTITGGVSVTF
ncbi:MAG: SusC/RagA family TonB-linked outer membrane protein [Rikenellaceae bacterium]